MSVHHQECEMKSGWQKKKRWDDDARSDEQHITGDGINKTVEWTVHSREEAQTGKAVSVDPNITNEKPAASPKQII
jgi:hypothetical protein